MSARVSVTPARRCCRAADVAEAFDDVVGAGRQRRSTHPPGRVLGDVAVMLADGGVAIGDLAVLPDQPGLFRRVASTATAWRVLDSVDDPRLNQLKVVFEAACVEACGHAPG